jgi:DedD protein
MAFFKLRFPGRFGAAAPSADALSNAPAESVEAIRKRARHRLLGSVVLVLGAVIGLPLLFDSQPRPVAIDTPIVIPDRNQAAPLLAPSAAKQAALPREVVVDAPEAPVVLASEKGTVANASALDPHEEVVTKDTKLAAKPEVKPEAKPEAKIAQKAEAKVDTKQEAKPEPKTDSKSADHAVRSVVQVGAFADLAKAKEARSKLEQAGLKTYTQDVDTKEGKRTRVRVGPFVNKEEADKTAEKIRKLNLPATVLKL